MHTISYNYRLVQKDGEIFLAEVDYDERDIPVCCFQLSTEATMDSARDYVETACQELETGKTLILDKAEESRIAGEIYDIFHHCMAFIPSGIPPVPFLLEALRDVDIDTLTPRQVELALRKYQKSIQSSPAL